MTDEYILPCRESLSFSEINNISGINERVGEFARFIDSQNKSLTRIVIDQNLKLDEAAKRSICTAILYNPRITTVRVESLTIDDAIAKMIARFRRMERLKRLEVQGFISIPNDSDERSIAYMLQTNAKLEELSLFAMYTDTTKLLLEGLARCSRSNAALRKLSVKCCYATSDCFLAIAQVLERYPALECLEILETKNDICAVERLAEGVEKSKSLTHISIHGRRINSQADYDTLINSFAMKSNLKSVSVGPIPTSYNVDALVAAVIEANPSIEHLSVVRYFHRHQNTPDTNAAALTQAVASNRSLIALSLDGFNLTTGGIKNLCDGLCENDTLESLSLCRNTINEEGMQAICSRVSQASSIKKLNLSSNKLTSTSMELLCQLLETNDRIEYLDLYWNKLSEESVTRMGNMLLRNRGLKTLKLWFFGKLGEPAARALIEGVKDHPSITTLSMLLSDRPLIRQELDYYFELNKGPKRILNEAMTLPVGLWPLILKRAGDDGRIRSKSPDVLFFFVKERCDLFSRLNRTA